MNSSGLFVPQIEIVNNAKFSPEIENTGIFNNNNAYTYYNPISKIMGHLYLKITDGPDANGNYVIKYDISVYKHVELIEGSEVNPYKPDKYVWEKYGNSLLLDRVQYKIDSIGCYLISDSKMLVLIYKSDLKNDPQDSVIVYVNDGTSWLQINEINDQDTFNGEKHLGVCNGTKLTATYQNDIIKLYEIININDITGFDVNLLTSVPVPKGTNNDEVIIPHYFSTINKKIVFATGIPNNDRYLIKNIHIYTYDNNNQITQEEKINVSNNNILSINKISVAINLNKNGTRIAFINIYSYYHEETNTRYPRYRVTLYSKNSVSGTWLVSGHIGGSLVDPTFVEINNNITDSQIVERKFSAEKAGEYRNIYFSEDDDGEYASVWTPIIKYGNDIVTFKPKYENIASFVRTSSVGK